MIYDFSFEEGTQESKKNNDHRRTEGGFIHFPGKIKGGFTDTLP